jgi:TonB family protein
MNKPFFRRIFHSQVFRYAAVSLTMLAGSIAAFCSPIHDAAKAGDLAKVNALLNDNPELVSSKDDRGWTPLNLAAANGHKAVVDLLLANKADVNVRDNINWTPLHLAVVGARKEVAELLLANKADVNARDNNGYAPLHMAALAGYKDIAELLLTGNAEVDAKDNDGMTALHTAAFTGHKDVLELLLANRAEVNAKDNSGSTPLDVAAFGVKELLRQQGGSNGEGLPGSIGSGGVPYAIGNGVKQPEILMNPSPPYTEEARRAHAEGLVILQAVIRKDGTVDGFKILKRLGYGLDISALNTIAAKWRFKPATRNGEPVDVIANIEVSFHIF